MRRFGEKSDQVMGGSGGTKIRFVKGVLTALPFWAPQLLFRDNSRCTGPAQVPPWRSIATISIVPACSEPRTIFDSASPPCHGPSFIRRKREANSRRASRGQA